MTTLYLFADQTGPIPLNELDANFAACGIFAGDGRRITGDMTNLPAVNRLSVQTSIAGSATEFQVLPSAGGAASAISVFTDPLVASGQFGRMSVDDGVELLFESGKLGGSFYVPMVWNTGGVDWMELSITGVLSLVNPCAFSVNRGSGNGTFSVANDTVTTVNWTTEEFDTGNFFDLTADRFTPPAGKYQLSGLATGGWISQGQYTVAIYKNGSPYKNGARAQGDDGAGGFIGANVSCTVTANGTDYFEMRVYQTNPATSAVNFLDNDVLLYFCGYRIG